MTKKTTYVSPIGTAVFPHLITPDTKFDAEGKFKTGIALSEEDMAKAVDYFETKYASQIKAIKNFELPIGEDKDGRKYLKASSKYRPLLIGPDKQPINLEKAKIWGGSTIRISANEFEYASGKNKGVSLQLNKVLVLKESGSDSSDFDDMDYSDYSQPTDEFEESDVQSTSKLDI